MSVLYYLRTQTINSYWFPFSNSPWSSSKQRKEKRHLLSYEVRGKHSLLFSKIWKAPLNSTFTRQIRECFFTISRLFFGFFFFFPFYPCHSLYLFANITITCRGGAGKLKLPHIQPFGLSWLQGELSWKSLPGLLCSVW